MQHLTQVFSFKKSNPGISMVLGVKKLFFIFFRNAIIIFFIFLHDDRGEHCPTSGPGIVSQRRRKSRDQQGIKCQKSGLFDIFSETLQYIFGHFCMMIEANTMQHLTQVFSFEKSNPGISMVLVVKKLFFFIFLGNATINFFDFLHNDRG